MTIPLITVVLDPPEISDPTNFETKADDLLNVGLPDLCTQINATTAGMNAAAEDLDAIIGSAGFIGTTTDSVTVGSGLKSFDVETGLTFRDGAFGQLTSTADDDVWMFGQIEYDPGTGATVMDVGADGFNGSGTFASWRLSLTGKPGPSVALASVSEIRAGVDTGKGTSIGDEFGALAEVTLTDAATIAVDLSTFYYATVSLGGARTLGNPTWSAGFVPKSGRIRVVTNGNTLAFASNWKRQGGAPSLSGVTEGYIRYDAVSATKIVYQFVRDPS